MTEIAAYVLIGGATLVIVLVVVMAWFGRPLK
jgi:hypothetical protein